MADNIFLMQAIMAQDYDTLTDAALDCPVVVLLDLMKAYDTLDRNFLAAALAEFGYSERFIDLVERIHRDTTACFLANGDLSSPLDVRTGIRQGCPLAPLLFLIAVELLKYAVLQTPGVSGVSLARAGRHFHHGFSAFVDDSAVIVEQGAMLAEVNKTLKEFGEISGLQVQPTKGHAIILNSSCKDTHVATYPVVPLGSTVRYLGVEVGLGDTAEANWRKRIKKLEQSLGKASALATHLRDRVAILNTIGLPALLFTAKYASPSPETLH